MTLTAKNAEKEKEKEYMGFLDAMKGANFNMGTVDSPDFNACYLTKKEDHFMITGAQSGTYEFSHEDIASLKVVAAGGDWIKYKMTFRDGKIAIIHSLIAGSDKENKKGLRGMVSVAPLERFFGDLL